MTGMQQPGKEEQASGPASGSKRRKIHHNLHHKQSSEAGLLPAMQDRAFYGAQLIRSISIALAAVGFDSVKPTALESFRAEVEEYMLHFLHTVRTSMNASRRTEPIPQDFILALANMGIEEHLLVDQLEIGIPPEVALPPIGPAPPEEETPRDLEDLIIPKETGNDGKGARRWIPEGFPAFPGENTWKSTAVFTTRETDPRQIREKATEEGMLAEKALRELMAAAKDGRKEKTTSTRQGVNGHQLWQNALDSIYKADEDLSRKAIPMSFDFDFGAGEGEQYPGEQKPVLASQSEGPLLVNYDRQYWRKSKGTAF